MKRFHALHAIFILVFILSACSDGTSNESKSDELGLVSKQSTDATGQAEFRTKELKENRKLIWTADLEFQVKNVDQSTYAITKLSEKYDGFVSNMELIHSNAKISNTISIRVPNKKFQSLVNAIKGESLFMDRANISSNDVTEEYVDIESRLKTKREVRDRYVQILNTKTGSVEDILSAEETIRVITEEIEVQEGRIRYLSNQVELSTVTLTMYQRVKHTDAPERYEKSYGDEASDSFAMGWNAIKVFFLVLIRIWPILLMGLIALFAWKGKTWWKRFMSKK